MPGLVPFGDGVGLFQANRTTITTSYDIFDTNNNLVGYMTSFNRTDSRSVQRIRHLSSTDAGRTVEQDPGPEEVGADATGFALYNDVSLDNQFPHYSLASRISQGTGAGNSIGGIYLFQSINSQSIPFNIRMEETHPSTGAHAITYYFNCMLTRYSKPVSLGTITVSETVAIQIGQVGLPLSGGKSAPTGIIIGALVS